MPINKDEVEITEEPSRLLSQMTPGKFYSFQELYRILYGKLPANEILHSKDKPWLVAIHFSDLKAQLDIFVEIGKLKPGKRKTEGRKKIQGIDGAPFEINPAVYYGLS